MTRPQMRKCRLATCPKRFKVTTKYPEQKYCDRKCYEADRANIVINREDSTVRGGVLSEDDREQLHMAHSRLVDAQVALEARRHGAVIEMTREDSYKLWGNLLGIKLGAA